MSDQASESGTGESSAGDSRTNAAEFTVSEISSALKRTVEDAFGNVRVRGEISGYRGPHGSGHAYFSLKDDRAKIDAVVWKGTMGRLKFRPEEGMEVIASGKLTTYPGSSKYQIVIDNLEPAGAGALMALLEERKKRLAAEGLFDPGRKQLLPHMPKVIGVVTSPTGAVIRDIIHRIKDRFPLHVIVWPVRVQGETSGAEVTAAVEGFNALPEGGAIPRPDLLIVARGGGSLEDLWGFNDEALARAVAASHIPVISAVGHETDWTLIDLVADVRAPTPTGAAEIAVPVKAELEATLAGLGARLKASTTRNFDRKRTALRAAMRALPSPDQLLALPRRRFDEATSRLGRALTVSTERKRARLGAIRLTPATLSRRIGEARKATNRDFSRAQNALAGVVRERRARLSRIEARLSPEPVARRNRRAAEALEALARRSDQAIGFRLERLRAKLTQAERLLSTLKLSDEAILERGYALVTDAEGAVLRRAAEVTPGTELSLRFADGVAGAIATGDGARPKPKPAAKAKTPGGQGSLFRARQMESAERHRRTWTVLAVLVIAFVLSSLPYSYPMSCWAAANEVTNKAETMQYARRVGGNFDLVDLYLQKGDFFLRNSSPKQDGSTTHVYVTNFRNLSCWYLNAISIDSGIVRVDVDATGKIVATH